MSNDIESKAGVTLFWFRRDLRLHDNAGLLQALRSAAPVLPVFIFDREILAQFPDRDDRRVAFIYQTLRAMKTELQEHGSDLWIEYGSPIAVFKRLLTNFKVSEVHTNRDYEPEAIGRDAKVEALCLERGVSFHSHKDQVIFEGLEVAKDGGQPYTVYTPYAKKWRAEFANLHLPKHPSQNHLDRLWRRESQSKGGELPTLAAIGFPQAPLGFSYPSKTVRKALLTSYHTQRDFPALSGTSRLGLHLRFGTVSVRELVVKAKILSETWFGELIWREFFMQILANFPHVATGPFRPAYAEIPWRHDRADFELWCEGRTGVPIVDAGMRELNATGFMHNRVRMITASYLAKSLLIDYRWGESYFARKLLDYDLASNNGNWQWVAGCGCDAAPYFRIFNPELQEKKFDPERRYVRRWVPEIDTDAYPAPMVDHATSRMRALAAYARGLGRVK